MRINGQLDQIKVKALKFMVNEKDEIFLGGKEKIIQWMLLLILPLAIKHLILLKATKHWNFLLATKHYIIPNATKHWNIPLTT